MSHQPSASNTVSPEILDIAARLAASLEKLTQRLEFALAIETDAELQSVIRQEAAHESCALALAEGGPYLQLIGGKVAGPARLRGDALPSVATFNLSKAIAESPQLGAFIASRVEISGARRQAGALVLALQGHAELLSDSDFSAVARWAPLMAVDAYAHTALIQMFLDEARPVLRSTRTDGMLRWYWGQIHALSHWTLIAAAAEPTAWLGAMAKSFEWNTWTPSYPLVRERILRLAVRGAWAAGRFGTSILDRYLRIIVEDSHLLRTFDAILGVVAIALVSPERAAIQKSIAHALAKRIASASDANERLVLAASERTVRLVFEQAPLAEQMTLARGLRHEAQYSGRAADIVRRNTARALDDDIDCADIDEQGYMPALVALPSLIAQPPSIFFETSRTGRAHRNTDARVRSIAERTLGPDPARHSHRKTYDN